MPNKKKGTKGNKSLSIVSDNLIRSVAEGLLAYRIFLSKCAVSSALSEYSFYDSFLRILSSKKDWIVRCEFPVPDKEKSKGDKKRIDFVIYKVEKNKKGDKLNILASIELKTFLSSGNSPKISQVVRDNNKLLDFQKIKKIGKHDSWILVLHNSDKKFNEKLEKTGFKSKSLHITCVNRTYYIEIIKVQKYLDNR
jgi:hypothetical protein